MPTGHNFLSQWLLPNIKKPVGMYPQSCTQTSTISKTFFSNHRFVTWRFYLSEAWSFIGQNGRKCSIGVGIYDQERKGWIFATSTSSACRVVYGYLKVPRHRSNFPRVRIKGLCVCWLGWRGRGKCKVNACTLGKVFGFLSIGQSVWQRKAVRSPSCLFVFKVLRLWKG